MQGYPSRCRDCGMRPRVVQKNGYANSYCRQCLNRRMAQSRLKRRNALRKWQEAEQELIDETGRR